MKHFFSQTIVALFLVGLLLPFSSQAKKGKEDKKDKEGYKFTSKIEIKTTPVKDQASSGTCWSYATTSFLETELIRLGMGEHDLSEMYFVRMAYPDKAEKYLRYHGMTNFGEGGQGHDVFNVIKEFGMVPEDVYIGLNYELDYHQHIELASMLTGILDNSLKSKRSFTGKASEVFDATLDIYLGEEPTKFNYSDIEYTPKDFTDKMGIVADDYIELSSYTSYPLYEAVDVEIPDNWSHDLYYNIPLDELMQVVNYAFENGYSVNWDGDVSEKGFSHKNGVAIVPEDDPKNMEESERLKWDVLSEKEQKEKLYQFDAPQKEKVVTDESRQKAFDLYKATDDHLMHLVGVVNDQNGTKYFKTKNSWADDSNEFGGYLHMSEAYFMLNTVAIQIHKDAIPAEIRAKLGI